MARADSPGHTPVGAPPQDYAGPRRSLVLSGGGMRLSYQAGAIKALFDSGLCFAHMDGTSGGALNLSMILAGLTPDECCARWRSQDPGDFASLLALEKYLKAGELTALGDADGVVTKVLPHLGIDAQKIRQAVGVDGTYNLCNYTQKINEVIPHQRIDTDFIVAGMSLPGVMPPVVKDGTTYIDSAFIQDANLMSAVQRGAEEIWLIWGMGNTATFHGGALRLYVQMLEMSASGALNIELERIAELNERIARGDSPYGQSRPISLHVIRPEYPLPLDPDLVLGKIDHSTLIEMGYADARQYLASADTGGVTLDSSVSRMKESGPGVRFSETLTGRLVWEGADAKAESLTVHATVEIRDVVNFAAAGNATARLVGRVDFAPSANDLLIYAGTFTVAVAPDKRDGVQLLYALCFDHAGHSYRLVGRKELRDDPGIDLVADATTLFATLHEGTKSDAPAAASATLKSSKSGLVQTITHLRAMDASGAKEAAKAIAAFGKMFLGGLWGAYAKFATRR